MTEDHNSRPPDVSSLPGLPVDFRAFHELYRPAYIKWAEPFLGSAADAEEAVDQAFEQIYVGWSTVLKQQVPEAYAWKVLKNRCIDLARARGRRATVTDFAAFETRSLDHAVDPISEFETSLSVYQAIQALPDRQRDAILLTSAHGYDYADAAMIMGITPAGVRSNVRNAKRRLKQALHLNDEEGIADDHLAN
ncbi:sigma-70 family RNA polymerase sigma factor [Streptomyces sp. NPDC050095]|uniref:RNA polymerase sigma factor n=1 Tax=unclassified Streptomyces TaxID=2593676 RepID=UPI0034449D6E